MYTYDPGRKKLNPVGKVCQSGKIWKAQRNKKEAVGSLGTITIPSLLFAQRFAIPVDSWATQAPNACTSPRSQKILQLSRYKSKMKDNGRAPGDSTHHQLPQAQLGDYGRNCSQTYPIMRYKWNCGYVFQLAELKGAFNSMFGGKIQICTLSLSLIWEILENWKRKNSCIGAHTMLHSRNQWQLDQSHRSTQHLT